ncbi:tryptophan synthase subunit beta [Candidatus Kaiserbacteria bacterium RIFCSPLOWO2_01_FULL_54_20]|uniref:Tryptophan synthase beta chain n=1 Tax=Candidatus Kaiserbacteria bacterium RIFCSPLOWO2_01_FULL_54_20 TaxID=1798513 RepID=A0A1F6EJK2_9BACT|nr:MAG: tryptophan synthase subunit beta [Candidatus Kaiserbacteria bacterium RIFCSPLOWO2_01_FULL_54_20]
MTDKHTNYGGAYVPEMLWETLRVLTAEFESAKKDPEFQREFEDLLKNYSGRPTPLIFAERATKDLGGAKVYLKNEGANHTGAHKITHCLGQGLLAKRLGKKMLIAETGAGQHGLATATVAAKLGLECVVFMGSEDIRRQRPNVFLMERLGTKVVPVEYGSKTLKDAVNEALKFWMENLDTAHYCIGSVLGPAPYPEMNRYFQSVISREIRAQLKERENKLPDAVLACVGGGSNAMGSFDDFLAEKSVRLIGVEAGGTGKKLGEHASRKIAGELGIFHGYKSLFLQTEDGQIAPTHSISAGLDYPGIGPDLADLYESGRVELAYATDDEAVSAADYFAKFEGVISALESAHALAEARKVAPKLSKDSVVVVTLSGRGDKDLFNFARAFKDESFKKFLKDEYERS